MSWVAVAAIGGTVIKGVMDNNTAKRAAKAQTGAADDALAWEKETFKQNRKDLQRYRQAGENQLTPIQSDLNRITTESATEDPIIGRQQAALEGDVNNLATAARTENPGIARQLGNYENSLTAIDAASAQDPRLQNEVNALSSLTTDPNAQKNFIEKNPFYQALSSQATQSVFANQAAKGKIGSGGTASALQENLLALGSGLLNQNLQQRQGAIDTRSGVQSADVNRLISGADARSGYITDAQNAENQNLNRLGAGIDARGGLIDVTDSVRNNRVNRLNLSLTQRQNLAALGENAAAKTGSNGLQSAENISTILGQRGNAQAAGIQAKGKAQSDLIGGVLGGIAQLCDERMKEDIVRIGEMDDGLPVYQFRYKGMPGRHIGVMAQEVEKVKPHAVIESGGIKYVNYGAL